MQTLVCLACGQEKPISEYSPDNRSKDGLQHTCRPCMRDRLRISRAKKLAGSQLPLTSATSQVCARCDQEKPTGEFSPDRLSKTGYRVWCRTCMNDYAREQRDRGSPRDIRSRMTHKYGSTGDHYFEMFDAQGGRCAICDNPEHLKTHSGRLLWLCVDHDHATGRIRALLCHDCNAGLGHFKDDPQLLQNALNYLRQLT